MKYIILMLMLFTTPVEGVNFTKIESIDLVPDYMVSEMGGYVGFMSVGVGYTYFEILNSEVIYGWVPAMMGGETLQSITMRSYVEMKGLRLGAGNVFSLYDDDTFMALPSRYPRGYYPATGMYTVFSAGYEVALEKEVSIFMEFVTTGYFLEAMHRSNGHLRLDELGTYGFGLKFNIDKD